MLPILACLFRVNLVTLSAFRADKSAALSGTQPRPPRAQGVDARARGPQGTPAAYAVRRTWRHKTRKQPFMGRLHAITAAQALLLATALWHLG
jgi:uncharacterized membrane protein YsdA (DUF1294 family)